MPSSRGHHGPTSTSAPGSQALARTVTEAVDAAFTRFDSNGDASITLAELTAILDPSGTHTTWMTAIGTRFTDQDTNGDGTLDRSDFLSGSTGTDSPSLIDALLQAGRGHGHGGHGGHGGQGSDAATRTMAAVVEGLVARFDGDAGGSLSLAELLAVLDPAGTRTQLASTVTSLYGTLDSNGDASISDAELTVAVTALDIDGSGSLDRADHVDGVHDAGTVDLIGVLLHLPDMHGHGD